jgi:hypothetical protein
MAVRCNHCNQTFEPGEGTPRCPICLRQSVVVEVARARTTGSERALASVSIPKLFVIGIVIAAAGSLASQLGLTPADPIAARSYRATLGVITLTGFVLMVVGGIQWLRRRRGR